MERYLHKIKPLLDAQKQSALPLNADAVSSINLLKQDICGSSLAVPTASISPLVIKSDASGVVIGASMNQAGRPIAFFSRTLSLTEQKYSAVEREAMAIVESFRKWADFIRFLEPLS